MKWTIFLWGGLLLIVACNQGSETIRKDDKTSEQKSGYTHITGKTMGTTYSIKYSDTANYKREVDSLLVVLNEELSTYDPNSVISKINRNETVYGPGDVDDSLTAKLDLENGILLDYGDNGLFSSKFFGPTFELSKAVYRLSDGAFDPTVMPLVNYWGFGYQEVPEKSSLAIDSLKSLIGFEKVTLAPVKVLSERKQAIRYGLYKQDKRMELDFSAVAKGLGVDLVGFMLRYEMGAENVMVEIGGEVFAIGMNEEGEPWKIGIDKPVEGKREVEAIVKLDDMAMATSGNYRNHKVIDGKKMVHTINPKTGYPETSNTLSATVLAKIRSFQSIQESNFENIEDAVLAAFSCGKADAFATAFMVMGYEKGLELAEELDGIEAYFIYADEEGNMKTIMTSGLEGRIKELE